VSWWFLWQRHQQIASRLAKKGFDILYFQDPVYLDFFEFIKKCRERNIFVIRSVSENLHVVNVYLPPFTGKLRRITEKIGLLFFKTYLKYLDFKPETAIFYSLQYTFLLNTLKSMNVKILYDCVDEHPNPSDLSVAKEEENLITSSSLVVATSRRLLKKISKISDNCIHIPNGVDFEHFNKALKIKEKPKDIQHLQHPIVGFIGGVYDWIDIDLLCKLADSHPDYSILLVGPVDYGRDKMKRRHNITMIGTKKYDIVPYYLASIDVCMIPFKINNVTLASNPIKLYEYLAAGKPVVSTALPEICDSASEVVSIGRDHDDFIRKVERAIEDSEKPEEKFAVARRIDFARGNSWDKRVQAIKELLENLRAV